MIKKLLLIICAIETLVIIYFIVDRCRKPTISPDVPPIEITKDSIIRDSIFIEVEKIKENIEEIGKQYTQDSMYIMSANDSMLFDTFSKYIEDYNNK